VDAERIRQRIREIARSPKNVQFEDIRSLLDNHFAHLFGNYSHRRRGSHHSFTVGRQTFTIPEPSRGQLRKEYVKEFLRAMEEEGFYDPEED
jgi:predicted RNA binding protein YcfA (HicA-like mRNA interferase family)